MADESHLRIGELSRRTGVSPELLRQWERRYDLLSPTRSPGGLRLYSAEDMERVRLMARLISDGVAAREAAELALRAQLNRSSGAGLGETVPGASTAFDADAARDRLRRSIEAFDEPAAQALMDEVLAAATIDAVLSDVVVPFLREVGERWQSGELSVAQEHFATHVLRGRLLGLARGWGAGTGRRALLACPSGERHDLGLVAFGLALRARGWQIHLLGSDTPVESIRRAVDAVNPELVVVSATTAELVAPIRPDLTALARDRTVAIAGAAAQADPPAGVLTLPGDPVAEADRVAQWI